MAREDIPLEYVGANLMEGRKKEKKEEKREEEKRSEKLQLLSRFPGDPIIDVCQSKRKSPSSWRELQIEIEIREF